MGEMGRSTHHRVVFRVRADTPESPLATAAGLDFTDGEGSGSPRLMLWGAAAGSVGVSEWCREDVVAVGESPVCPAEGMTNTVVVTA